MKKIFIITCITFLCTNTFCQETIKIKKKNKKEYYIEIYNVLKADEEIKEGKYKKKDLDGNVLEIGSFSDNKKNGLWTYYGYRGKPSKEGDFLNNEPVGIWKIYEEEDIPKYKYDFSDGSIKEYNWSESEKRETMIYSTDGRIKTVEIDSPALPIISTSISEQVYRNVRYPADAKDSGISGTVWISVIVNIDGTSESLAVETSVFPSLDNEALRAVTNMNGKWIPAFYNGEKVKSKKLVPIRFVLI